MSMTHFASTVLVFDLDDTLFPEKQYVRSGFAAAGRYLLQQGIASEDLSRRFWEQFLTAGQGQVFNEVLESAGIAWDRNLIADLVAVYRGHAPVIDLFPDARDVLDWFQGKKKLGLLSDGFLPAQRLKVDALGIAPWFEIMVFTEELGREFWKPHPAGFQKIMRALDAPAHDCVYIGDNPNKDFQGAGALGWKTVCVKRSGSVYGDAVADGSKRQAAIVVEDLRELKDIVV